MQNFNRMSLKFEKKNRRSRRGNNIRTFLKNIGVEVRDRLN
jgi:hypothetical protein